MEYDRPMLLIYLSGQESRILKKNDFEIISCLPLNVSDDGDTLSLACCWNQIEFPSFLMISSPFPPPCQNFKNHQPTPRKCSLFLPSADCVMIWRIVYEYDWHGLFRHFARLILLDYSTRTRNSILRSSTDSKC